MQYLCQFALAVPTETRIRSPFKIHVVEVEGPVWSDQPILHGVAGGDVDDPGHVCFAGRIDQTLHQQFHQQKMRQVIGLKLHFKPVLGQLPGGHTHDAGIVDDAIQLEVTVCLFKGADKCPHVVTARQVQLFNIECAGVHFGFLAQTYTFGVLWVSATDDDRGSLCQELGCHQPAVPTAATSDEDDQVLQLTVEKFWIASQWSLSATHCF